MSRAEFTKLVWNSPEAVEFASLHIFGKSSMFNNAVAMGIEHKGKLIAGIVYNNYFESANGRPVTIEMSIGSIDKRWCTRYNLKQLFAYPFAQLDLERVQTTCSAQEGEIIMFNKRLGFTLEGRHRNAWHTGCDALSWGMLRNECKWL